MKLSTILGVIALTVGYVSSEEVCRNASCSSGPVDPLTYRPEHVTPEEWALRVDLAAAYRLVALYGWDDSIFTHLTARVPGPEHHFLINNYGTGFDETTASSLVKIDIEGNIVSEHDKKKLVNGAGFTIHSAIHMAREDAQAVIHTHYAPSVAVSAMKDGLMPLSQTALVVRDQVAYHDFEGIADNLEERQRIISDLGDKKAMLLRNHGSLTVGSTIPEAFLATSFLLKACEIQVGALAGGSELLNIPSDASVTNAAGQGAKGLPMVAPLVWQAELRKLDRIDASYKM
eukprot:Clim_evm80s150 gene=Clim_evmTU80s150